MLRAAAAAALLVLLALLAGCTDAGGRDVTNTPDHFRYQGGGVKTGSESYRWSNSLGAATVAWSGGGTGSLVIALSDGAGLQLYEKTLSGAGGTTVRETTPRGAPGTWTVSLQFQGFSGGMDLRLDAS